MQPTPFEHPRFKIIPRPSRQLVILFSGTGVKDNVFHWWKMGQRLDASVILVNNGRNEWYMNGIPGLGSGYDETVTTFRRWADHLGADQIFTCGGSMGGSAAVLYGVPLGARVLGMGFETRFDYPASNFLRNRAEGFIPPVMDLRPLMATATQPIFNYVGEEEPVDLDSAARIADLPMVKTFPLAGIGHAVPAYFRNIGLMEPMFDAFLSGAPMPQVETGRGLTPGYPEAIYAAWTANRTGDWPALEAAARTAVDLYPTSAYAHAMLGRGILNQRRAADALEPLRRACDLDPDNADAAFMLALATRDAIAPEAAEALHRAIVAAHPNFGKSHYHLGLAHTARKDWPRAIASLEEALRCEPQLKNVQAKLDAVRKQQSRVAPVTE